jgi:hypothetical protein
MLLSILLIAMELENSKTCVFHSSQSPTYALHTYTSTTEQHETTTTHNNQNTHTHTKQPKQTCVYHRL